MTATAASDFRGRLAFDEREDLDDGYGNKTGVFVERFKRRAVLRPLRGGESVHAAKQVSRQPYLVIVRKCSETKLVTSDWQIRDLESGEVLNILTRNFPPDRLGEIDLTCETGSASD